MQNAILYQAYGGMDFINECRYSLLKYLQAYNLKPPPDTGIYIYTDQPHLFSDYLPFLSKLECIPVTEATVKQWKGPRGFVHRFKIEMIREFASRFDGNVLYCDTDTYATNSLEEIFKDIAQGSFYMHQYEGVIDRTKFSSFHKWEAFLSSTPIEYNGKRMEFSTQLRMYNAGVIGLNSGSKPLLDDVLALSDSIYQKFPKHIAEQFAFSYCLQTSGAVKTTDHLIAHYWNLKEFRQLLTVFFARNEEESIPSLVKKVHHIDALAIMHHKTSYRSLPFLQRFFRNLSGSAWRIGQYERKL
jgi:hypothetical protein